MKRAQELIDQGRATLRKNDRGGYTVPTDGLYPFQWNWDAGITALGWATFDEPRAWQELDMLFKGQWDTGLVPHIIFHAMSDQYFPGPEDWGVKHEPPTSSITQPPLLATMVRILYEQAKDKESARPRAAALLPKLAAYHRYLYRERDPDRTGLVTSYHPWESGMDNSPAWDAALARVPATERPYKRRDTQHVDSSQRPVKTEYDRYVYLMDMFRELKFDASAIYEQSPYKIQDVNLNAILMRANDDLLALCDELDYQQDVDDLQKLGEQGRAAIGDLWSEQHSCYLCRDQVIGELIPVRTTAGLMPLYGHVPTKAQAKQMGEALSAWLDAAPFGIASTHPGEPVYDAKRYWRGPTWLHINWMIADGLHNYGMTALAERVETATRDIIEKTGYWEYYDPSDASPCGGPDFSWTAAISLHWLLR